MAALDSYILNILQEKVVLLNQKGQENKIMSDNLKIIKNTVVKIISKYSHDKKVSWQDVYSGCPRKLEPKM